jgi:hypothetical protein
MDGGDTARFSLFSLRDAETTIKIIGNDPERDADNARQFIPILRVRIA